MSMDLRDMFKAKGQKADKEKNKLGAKQKPVIIDDEDDEFVEEKSKAKKTVSVLSVTHRKRQHKKGIAFHSDSESEEASPKKKKKTLEVQQRKSPRSKVREIKQVSDFFGSASIKRSKPLAESHDIKRKIKQVEVIPDSPQPATGGGAEEVLTESEVSQLLEPDWQEEEEESAGRKRRQKTSPKKETQSSVTPPVKKLKRMLSEEGSPVASTPKQTVRTPAKRRSQSGKKTSPQKPVVEFQKRTKPSPAKDTLGTPPNLTAGSTPSNRGASYHAYLQRQRSGPAHPGSKPIPEGKPNCLLGLTFVITGELDSLHREQASDLIKQYGGKVTTGISRKTSYLVVGREPGATKLAKARDCGTKEVSEDELLNLIETLPSKSEGPKEKQKSKKKSHKPSPSVGPSAVKGKGEDPINLVQPNSEGISETEPIDTTLAKETVAKETVTSPKMGNSQPLNDSLTPISTPKQSGVETLLWVDKYKPVAMKQLIGQQGEKSPANKLLKWLRNWEQNHRQTGRTKKPFGFGSQGDGSSFSAALLSGPPGVGKTTAANLACKEAGYECTELNASDTRNKSGLATYLATQLKNASIRAFTGQGGGAKKSHLHAVIMDEVDGMAGNEDRGGMQELIQLIKSTNVPIICICNDRQHQKIRSLANYCFDLRFTRPRMEQIKGAMMKVAFQENIKISPQALQDVIEASGQDVRQVLHSLCMWTAGGQTALVSGREEGGKKIKREVRMSPFDITRKLFSCREAKMTIYEKSDLFFQDYSFIPLFVQENYISVQPENTRNMHDLLGKLAEAANSLAVGDVVERHIRSHQKWGLLPVQAMYSCVIPGDLMRGHCSPQVSFPQWLGSNSKHTRIGRLLKDLQVHTRLQTTCNKVEFGMDYLPRLVRKLTVPLITESTDGVPSVVKCMDEYCLTREDWDSMIEINQFPGQPDVVSKIAAKVKSSFTRSYNKEAHKMPFALPVKVTKRKGSSSDYYGNEEEEEEEVDSDDITKSGMIKSTTTGSGKGKATGSGKDRATGSGKDRATGSGKGKATGSGKSKGKTKSQNSQK